MDPVKTDNEGELTSTMDNVISVPSKDEKSDTSSDATPTSSTDANIRPAASHIALDDPISSTSSDSLDQVKVRMDKGDSAYVNAHRVSTDNEADLLDITNITNSEKITEDVEDLVHDLESLLGESTDSFNVTSKFSKRDTTLRPGSGNSSNDTSSVRENSNVAGDDVLHELGEFTGDVISKKSPINTEKDSITVTLDKTLPVESSNNTIELELKTDISENKLMSDDHSNGEISATASTSNSKDDIDDATDKQMISESCIEETRQETFCIQDQDISHSEPKDIQLDTAESSTGGQISNEPSEEPFKLEDIVTSSEKDSNEKGAQNCIVEKSEVTGSEEVERIMDADVVDSKNTSEENSDGKESQDVRNQKEEIDANENVEKTEVDRECNENEEKSSEMNEKNENLEAKNIQENSENLEIKSSTKEIINGDSKLGDTLNREIDSIDSQPSASNSFKNCEKLDKIMVDTELCTTVEGGKIEVTNCERDLQEISMNKVEENHNTNEASEEKTDECNEHSETKEIYEPIESTTEEDRKNENIAEADNSEKKLPELMESDDILVHPSENEIEYKGTDCKTVESDLKVEQINEARDDKSETNEILIGHPKKSPSSDQTEGHCSKVDAQLNQETVEKDISLMVKGSSEIIEEIQEITESVSEKAPEENLDQSKSDFPLPCTSNEGEVKPNGERVGLDEIVDHPSPSFDEKEHSTNEQLVNDSIESQNAIEEVETNQKESIIVEDISNEKMLDNIQPNQEASELKQVVENEPLSTKKQHDVTVSDKVEIKTTEEQPLPTKETQNEENITLDTPKTNDDSDNAALEDLEDDVPKLVLEADDENVDLPQADIVAQQEDKKLDHREPTQGDAFKTKENVIKVETSEQKSASPEEVTALEPANTLEPADTLEPRDTPEPADTLEPADTVEPADTISSELEPANTLEPADTLEPTDTPEPADTLEPVDTLEPADTVEPADTISSEQEEKTIVKAESSEMEPIIEDSEDLTKPMEISRVVTECKDSLEVPIEKELTNESKVPTEYAKQAIVGPTSEPIESKEANEGSSEKVEDFPDIQCEIKSESIKSTEAFPLEIPEPVEASLEENSKGPNEPFDVATDKLCEEHLKTGQNEESTKEQSEAEKHDNEISKSHEEILEPETVKKIDETAGSLGILEIAGQQPPIEELVEMSESIELLPTEDIRTATVPSKLSGKIEESSFVNEIEETSDADKESVVEIQEKTNESYKALEESSPVDESEKIAEMSETTKPFEEIANACEETIESSSSVTKAPEEHFEPKEDVQLDEEVTIIEECKTNTSEVIEQDETALAVASLEGIDMDSKAPELTEKEKQEMEALRQAVESISNTNEAHQGIEITEPAIEEIVQENEVEPAMVKIMEEVEEETDTCLEATEAVNVNEVVEAATIDMETVDKSKTGIAAVTEDANGAITEVNKTVEKINEIAENVVKDDQETIDKSSEMIDNVIKKVNDEVVEETDENAEEIVENAEEAVENAEEAFETVEQAIETVEEAIETVEEATETVEAVNEVAEKSNETVEVSEADTKNSEDPSLNTNETATKITTNNEAYEAILPDSSQSPSDVEAEEQLQDDEEKECKHKTNERPRRHKKSSDNKTEDLSTSVDISDKEKPYSPKVTIKPIKVPDEEVSTTSNSENEVGKGSLKMTITKQSDKMHSILKVCDVEQAEAIQEQEEPLPKLKIKSKPGEQASPKMSTRSSRQTHQSSNVSQRSSSPRITIKPVVKPETLSPLKIKIGLKADETTKKHSPKLNIKPIPKQEEEHKEMAQSPKKVIIKNFVKPPEEEEQAPKITIKPIPKPDLEKETLNVSPKLNIKPIKKPEEEENDVEKISPKITIKPIVKPPEPDSNGDEVEDDSKKRIVLKINKGNLPAKESRKREHLAEDEKAEKLAKITVKFSKEGGHPHIVQQSEEAQQKRPHEEPNHIEKNKKQKLDQQDTNVSTRSKQKEHIESQPETKKNNPSEQTTESNDNPKPKQSFTDNPGHGGRGKHKDANVNSPIESKRSKLRESKLKDNTEVTKVEDVEESAVVNSPVTTTEDIGSTSVHNPGPEPITPRPTSELSLSNPSSESSTPLTPILTPPQPRKRGRPRKIPLEQRPSFETPPQSKTVDTPTPGTTDSGRPKRSCRGQSALDTLGLKPRKPRGSRGRGRPPAGESRAISMKPEKEPRLSQARLKLLQKSLDEAGTVNVISIGTGDDKLLDIEDVLPHSQVEKKIVDIKEEKDAESTSEYHNFPIRSEGKNLKEILQQAIKGKLGDSSSGGDDSESVSLEVKRELLEDLNPGASTNPNPKGDEVASEEVGVSSSSISPPHKTLEAMLVSDPVPQDATLPKSFGTGDDSSLLVPEPSSVLHSTVSSTTGPSEIVMVDEETRMSAETNSRAQTPAKQMVPMDTIEESQSSVLSTATTESGKASSSRPSKAPRLEVQEPEGSVISPDQLAEYYWNGNGPFMLQEQVAHFLGIKSFKRKYPNIKRRMLEMQERDFIRESGLVSEHMCDLGLTAVNSADILDIMYSDFQDKYEEYCKHQRDRQTKELINKQKALSLAASHEKNKADLTENAKQSAAQWNVNFNKTRREQRRACMDLQTYTVHFPKGKMKQYTKGKIGNYPVALVPGQFTDYFKEFTPTEINNLPLNTMCYEPIDYIRPEQSSDSDSDGSDSDSDSSSSGSDSNSSSSSGVEDCKLCKHSPKKVIATPVTK